ncbi:MAG TPA: hypothetical protein DCM62_04245 [Bacteroidales bacterium]|nr:hypothetical protein [Bacteroidales bacterium]
MILQPRRGEMIVEKQHPKSYKPRMGDIEHFCDEITNSAKQNKLLCHPARREGSVFKVLLRGFTSTLRLRSVDPLLSATTSFSMTMDNCK